MSLILLRHGRRDNYGDVPLNAQGLAQAQELATTPDLQKVDVLLCSPKQRAQMTLEPLAKQLGLSIQTLDSLDQMGAEESEWAFQERVTQVLEKETWETGTTLICSHSDWLTMATTWMAQTNPALRALFFDCAQFEEFTWQEQKWHRL